MLPDDKILIEKLRKGSTDAFDRLYNEHSGKLYNLILKISTRNRYLAEEIVQRVFIKIWELREAIDPLKSFSAFIATIARNMLINEMNHEVIKYVHTKYVMSSEHEPAESEEEKIEYRFFKQYIETVMRKLTPARKEVFMMSRFEQLTVKEIAQRLGKSEKTVEKQLEQANRFIREQIQNNYDTIF